MSSRHKRERIGAGRFFLLPWVFSFSPWGSSFYGGPCNVSRQKQNLQQDKANQRQDNRNSRQISRNSRQDNANFSRRKWEATAEVKCHGGCNLTTTSSWIMAESVEGDLECEYLELPEDEEVLRAFNIHFSKQFLYNDARYSSSSPLQCVPYWPVSK